MNRKQMFLGIAILHALAADIEALYGNGAAALAFALVAILCWLVSVTPEKIAPGS